MKQLDFNIAVRDIPLDIQNFNRLMGFGNIFPTPFDNIFKKMASTLETGTARGAAVIFDDNETEIGQNKIIIEGIEFDTGGKINSYLKGSSGIALFICTLGAEFEDRMKSFDIDPVESYFADTIGSLKCETLADILHDSITAELKKSGLLTTNRYSPGYCGWNVREQQKLFSFFDETKTGISLNESCLMIPVKSISGIIGTGANVRQMPYTCDICADIDCFYRKLK